MEAHHSTKLQSIDQANGKLVSAVDWGVEGVLMLGDAMELVLGDVMEEMSLKVLQNQSQP